MADGEPALLREPPTEPVAAAPEVPAPRPSRPSSASLPRARTVHVAGFWRRLGGGLVDLAIILPAAAIVTWIAAAFAGVSPRDADLLLLVLGLDPALIMALAMVLGVGAVYALVFHVVRGRTIGMQLVGVRVIDVYGDPPSPARSVVRTLGYLAGALTLSLGYIWIAFDGEKRGLHDWIAGTYVIRG
jgi:uncharacterized RDD family membrane protein YckC